MPSQIAKQMLEGIKAQGGFNMPLEQVRQALSSISETIEMPGDVSVVKEAYGGALVEIFEPAENDDPKKVVVYSHGGGYGIGVYNINRRFTALISKLFKRRVILVDYKTAPEHVHPAPKVDMINVYKHLLSNEYTAKDISFIGDSSGCGLILTSLFDLRVQEVPMPSAIAMMYPMLDMTYTGDSMKTRAELDPYALKKRVLYC